MKKPFAAALATALSVAAGVGLAKHSREGFIVLTTKHFRSS